MADEYGTRSLVDERPELIVHIPEAAERPRALQVTQPPAAVFAARPTPWIERKESPWIIGAAAVALIALLVFLQPRTIDVGAVPQGGGGGTDAVVADAPPWAALEIPVPESYRTHTVNVDGDVDALEIADLGPGAAQGFVGSVATADGPTVQQIFDEHAFSISSPTGATVIAFMPYQAEGAPILAGGEEVTFVGTLMPVPDDFAAMVGTEAAAIGARTGVYVQVVPETLDIPRVIPETP